ncbi:MAG: conditioned medium factor, partial [Planctomycetota bacterium]
MRTALLPPLELRAVRVQDPDSHAVLARADRLAVALDPRWRALPALHAPAPPLTALAGMTAGVTGPTAIDRPGLALRPGLVLSHGYCSGSPPWPNGDFSGTRVAFNDLNQNRSHDQFANLLAAQAWGAGLTSYGVVGHSQGGAAALHLLTFYESGLDLAQGARRIQSVGTPYQGTPLASLGFFACGVNNDLTPGGAATWLSSIPSWARAEVSYYTTANDGGACQFLTALLLSNPEDGTTENARGQLPGAMNMGFVTGWCHTTGMSDPPQYRDASRNAIMDAAAAR